MSTGTSVSYINISGTFFYLCSLLDGLLALDRILGTARGHDRGRRRDHPCSAAWKISARQNSNHLRQRIAVRLGFVFLREARAAAADR